MFGSFHFKSHLIFCSIFIVAVAGNINSDNPFAQLIRKTLISTARSCMNNVNATESDIEHLRHSPPYPEKAACIVKCLLEKIGVVKHNKFSKDGFVRAVTPLVLKNKKKMEHMKSVSENCEKEINHNPNTPCLLANEITSCIYKYAPELQMKV